MPGKFEGNSDEALAERLYQQSLDGVPSVGEAAVHGWYGLVNDTPYASYILREDDQGFVDIVFGPVGPEEAETEFERIEAAMAAEEEVNHD